VDRDRGTLDARSMYFRGWLGEPKCPPDGGDLILGSLQNIYDVQTPLHLLLLCVNRQILNSSGQDYTAVMDSYADPAKGSGLISTEEIMDHTVETPRPSSPYDRQGPLSSSSSSTTLVNLSNSYINAEKAKEKKGRDAHHSHEIEPYPGRSEIQTPEKCSPDVDVKDLEQGPAPPVESPPYHVFTRSRKKELVYIVSLAALFSPLSSNIYFPALTEVSKVSETRLSVMTGSVTDDRRRILAFPCPLLV
jgi:hypothetical protein